MRPLFLWTKHLRDGQTDRRRNMTDIMVNGDARTHLKSVKLSYLPSSTLQFPFSAKTVSLECWLFKVELLTWSMRLPNLRISLCYGNVSVLLSHVHSQPLHADWIID